MVKIIKDSDEKDSIETFEPKDTCQVIELTKKCKLKASENTQFMEPIKKKYIYCSFNDLFLLVPILITEPDSTLRKISTLAKAGLTKKRSTFRYAMNIMSNREVNRWFEFDLSKGENKTTYSFKDDSKLNNRFFKKKRALNVSLCLIFCMLLTEDGQFFDDPILTSNKRTLKKTSQRYDQYYIYASKFHHRNKELKCEEMESLREIDKKIWLKQYRTFLGDSLAYKNFSIYENNFSFLCYFFAFIFLGKTLATVKKKRISPFFFFYIENFSGNLSYQIIIDGEKNSQEAFDEFCINLDKMNSETVIVELTTAQNFYELFSKLCKPIEYKGEVQKIIKKNDSDLKKLKKDFPNEPEVIIIEKDLKAFRNQFKKALSGNSFAQLIEEEKISKRLKKIK